MSSNRVKPRLGVETLHPFATVSRKTDYFLFRDDIFMSKDFWCALRN